MNRLFIRVQQALDPQVVVHVLDAFCGLQQTYRRLSKGAFVILFRVFVLFHFVKFVVKCRLSRVLVVASLSPAVYHFEVVSLDEFFADVQKAVYFIAVLDELVERVIGRQVYHAQEKLVDVAVEQHFELAFQIVILAYVPVALD